MYIRPALAALVQKINDSRVHYRMQIISRRPALFSFTLSLLATASFWHGTAGASEPQAAPVVTYSQIVAAYKANPQDAAAKYTKKRLAFSGKVMRMGGDAGTTYFGAVADDGSSFDTSFDVADQDALKPKFKDGKLTAFQMSNSFVFECLNEGFLANAMVPSPKLVNCRAVK